MSCCEMIGNGVSPGGGGDPLVVFAPPTITTTDAAAQQVVLAQFPVDGAAASVEGWITGSQVGPAAGDAGDRGGWFHFWVQAARNSIGTNLLITGLIGPSGYTDSVAAPWNTVGVPVGWSYIGLAIAATSLVLNFNGAAGQTIEWNVRAMRSFAGGATP